MGREGGGEKKKKGPYGDYFGMLSTVPAPFYGPGARGKRRKERKKEKRQRNSSQ